MKGVCKGCSRTDLALPHPGPRCHRCNLAWRKRSRTLSKARRVERVYGLTAEQYDALYAHQGGVCALCRRATGQGAHKGARRLAVDHWHGCQQGHAPNVGCPECCRGLVCSPCNDALAHFRDDPEAFIRSALYLITPPWRSLRETGLDNSGQEGAESCP